MAGGENTSGDAPPNSSGKGSPKGNRHQYSSQLNEEI